MEPYTYSPLPSAPDPQDIYIRLCILQPASKVNSDGITCTILTTLLSKAPPYDAVSYCWGDNKNQTTINLISSDPDDGSTSPPRSVHVPATLIPFFLRARPLSGSNKQEEKRPLWIDSISINQADNAEKEIQVSRMRDIYIHATQTHIWLGEESENSTEAFNYMHELHNFLINRIGADKVANPENLTMDDIIRSRPSANEPSVKIGDPRLEAIFKLIERPWFTRAWIVQEVVVSSSTQLVCGASTQPWLTLIHTWVYLMGCHSWLWSFYPAQKQWQLLALSMSQIEWKEKTNPQWWRLLCRHRRSEATDGRDKLFSFWGLGCRKQFEEMGVEPRYGEGEGIEKLYAKVAVAALARGCMEVFGVPRPVGIERLNIPSWVPDWRGSIDTPSSLSQYEGSKIKWMPPWHASKDSVFEPKFSSSEGAEDTPTKLRLQGYILGRIDHITPVAWRDIEYPTSSGSTKKTPTLYSEAALLRATQAQIRSWESVLIPCRTSILPNFLTTPIFVPAYLTLPSSFSKYIPAPSFLKTYPAMNTDSYFRAAYTTLFGGILLNGDDKGMRFVISYIMFCKFILLPMYLFHVHNHIWPWTLAIFFERFLKAFGLPSPEMFFRTHGGGSPMVNRKAAVVHAEDGMKYMALVPSLCDVGDFAVVCKGIKTPLMLRGREGTGDWEFLGDAYVHGVMKGSVWEAKTASGHECEEFWLA